MTHGPHSYGYWLSKMQRVALRPAKAALVSLAMFPAQEASTVSRSFSADEILKIARKCKAAYARSCVTSQLGPLHLRPWGSAGPLASYIIHLSSVCTFPLEKANICRIVPTIDAAARLPGQVRQQGHHALSSSSGNIGGTGLPRTFPRHAC